MAGRKPTHTRTHPLAVIRVAMGLSMEKFAGPLGISRQYLDNIEMGQRRLNADLIEKIQQVYGIEPNELLGIKTQNPAYTQQTELMKMVRELDQQQQDFLMDIAKSFKKLKPAEKKSKKTKK